jgi:threonylcarbamoyladenosine tRNA methylthiotransferase MtaB
MKVFFETFGCRLNRAEALQEEARYLAAGHTLADSHKSADIIIVRACSVTRRAQHDCEKLISHLERKYPLKKIFIQGCIQKNRLTPRHIQERYLGKSLDGVEPIPQKTARAYLKIQDGCNCKCTFCIVPSFRGKSVSIDSNAVLDKAKRFIDAGYHEIVLTGCNLSLYASNGKSLVDLSSDIANLSRECRVRIGSVEPGKLADELIDLIAENPNTCRFLHLSIQSGSTKILSAMGRRYSINDVESICSKAVRKIPFLGLGADIICGFPGEQNHDFRLTENLIRKFPFSNLHAFPYSERAGTIAATLPGAVDREIRRRRAYELTLIAANHRKKLADSLIGKEVEIIVEKDASLSGWTSQYLPFKASSANVKHNADLRKKLVKVKVTGVENSSLIGIKLSNGR